jgi:hypothetical protein
LLLGGLGEYLLGGLGPDEWLCALVVALDEVFDRFDQFARPTSTAQHAVRLKVTDLHSCTVTVAVQIPAKLQFLYATARV